MQNLGGRQSPLATCVLTHLVVHLLRAVEYIDHDAKGSTQVFGSLSLPCACRAGRRSTHGQVQGLGQGDVASKYSGDTHTCNTDEEHLEMKKCFLMICVLFHLFIYWLYCQTINGSDM